MQNQNVVQTGNYLKFNKLPKTIQESLLERQDGKKEGFAFKTSGVLYSLIVIPLVIVWIGIVLYLTDDYLWSNAQMIILGIISLAALYSLLHSSYKLIQWLTSPSRITC